MKKRSFFVVINSILSLLFCTCIFSFIDLISYQIYTNALIVKLLPLIFSCSLPIISIILFSIIQSSRTTKSCKIKMKIISFLIFLCSLLSLLSLLIINMNHLYSKKDVGILSYLFPADVIAISLTFMFLSIVLFYGSYRFDIESQLEEKESIPLLNNIIYCICLLSSSYMIGSIFDDVRIVFLNYPYHHIQYLPLMIGAILSYLTVLIYPYLKERKYNTIILSCLTIAVLSLVLIPAIIDINIIKDELSFMLFDPSLSSIILLLILICLPPLYCLIRIMFKAIRVRQTNTY